MLILSLPPSTVEVKVFNFQLQTEVNQSIISFGTGSITDHIVLYNSVEEKWSWWSIKHFPVLIISLAIVVKHSV